MKKPIHKADLELSDRRTLLKGLGGLGGLVFLGVGCDGSSSDAQQGDGGNTADSGNDRSDDTQAIGRADATPDGMDNCEPEGTTPQCGETEDNALGPAYLPDAPFRTELNVLDWPGVPLVMSGRVLGPDCKLPVANAVLEVWQADDEGCYDGSNIGCGGTAPDPAWPLRGRLTPDATGRYTFSTIRPGLYPGRTRHVHIRVTAPGYQTLVTQIYFAGEPANATDGLIKKPLIISLCGDASIGLSGFFPIVLAKTP